MRLRNTKRKLMVIFKYLKIYIIYIFSMAIAIALCVLINELISNIDANFEANSESESEANDNVKTGISYNYFMDFSPSMLGFLYEDLAGGMKSTSEAFTQINARNENNYFYWCADSIEAVTEARNFYESMKSENLLLNYYDRFIRNNTPLEGMGEQSPEEANEIPQSEFEQMISSINLADVFATIDSREEGLNVIITDLNFLQDLNDEEGHNNRLKEFAVELGKEVENGNICIYTVNSNYSGIANDAFTTARDTDVKSMFYVIVFSDDDDAFLDYCQQFEGFMEPEQIYGKYELLRRINGRMNKLEMNLNEFNGLNLVTNENLNFANGLFENLDTNEFAIQLVTNGTTQGMLTVPVSEVNFSGYYSVDVVGLDDTKIDVETELYRNIVPLVGKNRYEKYDDSSMVLYQNAGIYGDSSVINGEGRWYLHINMTINTHPNIPQQDTWYQRQLENMRRRYFVMNLKFYMVEPSFSKPEWISTTRYPNVEYENMMNLEDVIDEVIHQKERTYISLPEEERYIGNAVIYILY